MRTQQNYPIHVIPHGMKHAPEHENHAEVCGSWCALNLAEFYIWMVSKLVRYVVLNTPERKVDLVRCKALARHYLRLARDLRLARAHR